jgi:hypothetical protein
MADCSGGNSPYCWGFATANVSMPLYILRGKWTDKGHEAGGDQGME